MLELNLVFSMARFTTTLSLAWMGEARLVGSWTVSQYMSTELRIQVPSIVMQPGSGLPSQNCRCFRHQSHGWTEVRHVCRLLALPKDTLGSTRVGACAMHMPAI